MKKISPQHKAGGWVASEWGKSVGYWPLSYHAAVMCGVAEATGENAVVGPARAFRCAP